ncbi:MAG: hypothetical protein ACKO1J_01900 [Tagaea sp.]
MGFFFASGFALSAVGARSTSSAGLGRGRSGSGAISGTGSAEPSN